MMPATTLVLPTLREWPPITMVAMDNPSLTLSSRAQSRDPSTKLRAGSAVRLHRENSRSLHARNDRLRQSLRLVGMTELVGSKENNGFAGIRLQFRLSPFRHSRLFFPILASAARLLKYSRSGFAGVPQNAMPLPRSIFFGRTPA